MMISCAGNGVETIDTVGARMLFLAQVRRALGLFLGMPEHVEGMVGLVAWVSLLEGAGASWACAGVVGAFCGCGGVTIGGGRDMR